MYDPRPQPMAYGRPSVEKLQVPCWPSTAAVVAAACPELVVAPAGEWAAVAEPEQRVGGKYGAAGGGVIGEAVGECWGRCSAGRCRTDGCHVGRRPGRRHRTLMLSDARSDSLSAAWGVSTTEPLERVTVVVDGGGWGG